MKIIFKELNIICEPMPGLEPGTPRLEVWCAIRLRHTGKTWRMGALIPLPRAC